VKLWVDAQLSPAIASWLRATFGLEVSPVRELGLRDASDDVIFEAARAADATVMTKDADFVRLLERHGPPPRVLWVTCGNTSNTRLKEVLTLRLAAALSAMASGEVLVEISDAVSRDGPAHRAD
jgi:predicted nuclease of predicted toxin-antitoxin system